MSSDAKEPETFVSRALRELSALAALWRERKGVFALLALVAATAAAAWTYSQLKQPAATTVITAAPSQATSSSAPASAVRAEALAPVKIRNTEQQVPAIAASQIAASASTTGTCSDVIIGTVISGKYEKQCPK